MDNFRLDEIPIGSICYLYSVKAGKPLKHLRIGREHIKPLDFHDGTQIMNVVLDFLLHRLETSYHLCHIRYLEREIYSSWNNPFGIDADLYVESLKLQLGFYKRKYPEEFI